MNRQFEWGSTPLKYVEEASDFTSWVIIGDGDLVDIDNGEYCPLTRVPRDIAEKIIREREAFLTTIRDAWPA